MSSYLKLCLALHNSVPACSCVFIKDKLGLSSAKLSRDKFGCLEVIFEVVSKDNLNKSLALVN